MNNKKIIPIIIVLAVVFAILGATFAYWSWASDNANKTNVTFTIAADFSCGINGEGNITGANLAPASCTNSTYAIQRAITTTITNNGSDPVSMDMWLKVNSIDSGLSGTSNFKWALTTDSTSCTNNEVSHGSFQGKTANSTITLFTGETNTATYYLYIWLDSAETSTATQNQSFSLSIGGACTNEVSNEEYVYTLTLFKTVGLGPIPSDIEIYHSHSEALQAFDDLMAVDPDPANRPMYFMHKAENISAPWYIVSNDGSISMLENAGIFANQGECLGELQYWDSPYYDEGSGVTYTYSCMQYDSVYAILDGDGYNSYYDNMIAFPTLNDCVEYNNGEVSTISGDATYTCSSYSIPDSYYVRENYIVFEVTQDMVTDASTAYIDKCDSQYSYMSGTSSVNYSSASECKNDYHGMTAGTYTIRGGVDESESLSKPIYDNNKATLLSAYGSSNCSESYGNNEEGFSCSVLVENYGPGAGNNYFSATAYSPGLVQTDSNYFILRIYGGEAEGMHD